MKNPIRKIVIVVAIVWGGLWYLSQEPPEEPVPTAADPEMRKQVMALLKKSKKAKAKQRADIQEQLQAIGPAGVPIFVESLEHKDPIIRAFAADALKYSGDISVAPHLENCLIDNHPAVRKAALTALGQLGAVETVPAIIVALDDGNREVRCHAALALGSLGDDRAVLPLVGTLHNDPYPPARQTAANSLGEIGSLKALRSLKAAMDDPDPKVRGAAGSAVKRIKQIEPIGKEMEDLGNWLDEKLQDFGSTVQDES